MATHRRDFDFIVLGSGIAGLNFALRVAGRGRVAVVTKKNRADSNTNWAQGGIASVTHVAFRRVTFSGTSKLTVPRPVGGNTATAATFTPRLIGKIAVGAFTPQMSDEPFTPSRCSCSPVNVATVSGYHERSDAYVSAVHHGSSDE